ncbi:MAG: hypothetical protein ACMXYK_03185 [Candidatus Woesearchaeota archaeon]
MNPTDELNKRQHFFFLSECKKTSEEDLAFLIELMRASQHVKDIFKLMTKFDTEGLNEDEEMEFNIENDSLMTLILNVSAAQLREAIKVYFKFSKKSIYTELCKLVEDKKNLEQFHILFKEYDDKKGYIYETLEPIRNSIFHYLPSEALEWVKAAKLEEIQRKPRYFFIDCEKYEFGPGLEYDSHIYAKFLFWGNEGFESLFKSQKRLWELQLAFLNVVKDLVSALLQKEGINKRSRKDMLRFAHGYK